LYFIAGFLRICGYFVGLPVNSIGAVEGETKPKGCSQLPAEDRVYRSPEQGWR
jgi:hypothetical protein